MKFQFSPYISIQVKDYEKAINFYQQVLGMNLTESNEKETYLRCEPINFCYEKSGIPGKVFFEFKVESVKETKVLLEKEGCKVTQVYSEKSIIISDPYGMNFHIWEE